ncbi:uncharacterized protein LOC109823119 [Asparagus officinalis]|uniref:uncharacterized protein LOC109823119 n=1 Tax=Asparagus officinalis TaxID=4686 RepID=UPI00098E20AE|nr:uncharacterized protein LOC109823119 [Asparagus officinalis]
MKVLQKVDELCRNYLWGKNDQSLKVALVSWEKICLSKDQGGLGIYSAANWNRASAIRNLWYVHINKELLWIRWIHGNYLKRDSIWQVKARNGDSWTWKQMLKIRDNALIQCGGEENLKQLLASYYKNTKIQLSSLYKLFSHNSSKVPWSNTVWGGLNYPKHSFICWLAVQNRLQTRDRLMKRGIVMLWLQFKWRACNWHNLLDWYCNKLRGRVQEQRPIDKGNQDGHTDHCP